MLAVVYHKIKLIMTNILEKEIQYLHGIGPKRGELLFKELGIRNIRDLLYSIPFRYIDKSKIYSINEIDSTNSYIQLKGKITSKQVVGESKGKRFVAKLSDSTGNIELVFFKGIKWVAEKLTLGKEYIVFGKPSEFNRTFNIVHPDIEEVNDYRKSVISRFEGVYPSTEKLKSFGISQKVFSRFIYTALNEYIDYISESLPGYIVEEYRLMPIKETLKNIHFPNSTTALDAAQRRMKFEELFYLQLSLLKQKYIRTKDPSNILIKSVGQYFNTCYNKLPFGLTNAQKRVIKEIRADMLSGRQMNRLLQGDVGSGKTMVALLSALLVADNGFQSCIMAPTEVLATQHYIGTGKLLEGTGIRTALLTGSTKKKEREEIAKGLEDGSIHILFGTHAVIEDKVKFLNLGFAVIDEQHRFGVEQRAKIRQKSKTPPHVLVMTATPIPRTLSMTLYGDLDVSVIDELPPGRKPIQTIHISEGKRQQMFNFIKKEIQLGRQAFIVFPLIKESETMDYENLQSGYERIVEEFPAPEYITAVVHGQQKNEDKAHDMKLFSDGKAHILVATSVIEVGVDVPNASVMVIESAERFGLSQLHQLRGRVGRGAEKSYCILMTGYKLSKESRQRIDLMCSTNDGFELAEADLRMRGPGDIEGTQQSGIAIELKVSNLAKDGQILTFVREIAEKILEEDPLLSLNKNKLLTEELNRIKKGLTDINYAKIS